MLKVINKRNWIFCEFLIVAALLTGCSARPANGLDQGRIYNYTSCVLRSDQGRGSLEGSWASLPVPVVFDNDFYITDNGEILPSLRSSINTWNIWGNLKPQGRSFNITNDGNGAAFGRTMPVITSCSQAAYTSQVTDVVGIWKITSAGSHANQRDSCGTNKDGVTLRILPTGVQGTTDWITLGGHITGSSILLNFEEFNAPGKGRVDVESLLLHELGHVLGLLHSCNGSTSDSIDTTSAPACRAGINYQYLEAVMFPFLEINQMRRKLMQNDYNRINCLY